MANLENAGSVTANISGLAEILNGAQISSSTGASGNAGMVTVNAGAMRLDGAGSEGFTGLSSDAYSGSSGNAGSVTATVSGLAEILNGAIIRSRIWSSGDAGSVTVNAGSLRLDGAAGLASDVMKGTGNAGSVTANISGLAEILNGAEISSSTFSSGNAGNVTVNAGAMRLDRAGSNYVTGLSSNAESGSGNAGSVTANVSGLSEILNGAVIRSRTWSSGDAGSVTVNAGSLRLDGAGSDYVTGLASDVMEGTGNAGNVTANVTGLAEILNGAEIRSSNFSAGNAGTVTVNAGSMRLDRAGSDNITGLASNVNSGSGYADSVTATVSGLVEILNGAEIRSSTFLSGNAGDVMINAGSLRLDGAGSDYFTGLSSDTEKGSSGNAGNVTANISGLVEILNGAEIRSSTFSAGNAGNITVNAGAMHIDRAGSDYFTGLGSTAEPGSIGNAGSVTANISGLLEILNGGIISSGTWSSGSAGSVTVNAESLRLDRAGSNYVTGLLSDAEKGSSGNAGSVTANVTGLVEVLNGAWISSDTSSSGNAGDVTIKAGSLRLDRAGSDKVTGLGSNAYSGSSGNAGNVTATVSGLAEVLNGAWISSDTHSSGDAGSVMVNAGSLRLDRAGSNYFTGLASSAEAGSSGNAGTVSTTVGGRFEILNGALISTSTLGAGNAGDIHIHASDLLITGWHRDFTRKSSSGIFSGAFTSATGQVGRITLDTNTLTLRDGGTLSIQAAQTLPDPTTLAHLDTRLTVNANLLNMDHGVITAASTGNVPAATLVINAHEARLTNGSRITTESQNADAGPIIIDGGWFWLDHSQVTTSANGQQGNGGDIVVNSKQLILDGGFIQANTAAQGAHGGDIYINSKALLMPGNQTLAIGELQRQVFDSVSQRNVIQAAAPGGEQGRIEVSGPLFDISGAIAGVHNPYRDPASLFRDPCAYFHTAHPSSLVDRMGGGAEIAPEKACTVPFIGERLDRVLSAEKIVQKNSKQDSKPNQKKKAKRKQK